MPDNVDEFTGINSEMQPGAYGIGINDDPFSAENNYNLDNYSPIIQSDENNHSMSDFINHVISNDYHPDAVLNNPHLEVIASTSGVVYEHSPEMLEFVNRLNIQAIEGVSNHQFIGHL